MKWLASFLCLVCVSALTVAGTSTSEGTQFAIALSPSMSTDEDAELIVNARETTDINITTSTSNEVFTVYGNWSLHYDVDYNMRGTDGIENKGILVTSSEPITIHVATLSRTYDNTTPDACLARPVTETSVEYTLVGYHDMIGGTIRPMAFYMIVATQDDTEVDVYFTDEPSLEDEHFNLNQYEVFTRDLYYVSGGRNSDFTGSRVVATKPVSVYSGPGLASVYAPGASLPDYHYLSESMPTMDNLGTEYTTFPIHHGGDGGYEVRVIAVANDTDVSIPAFSADFTLNMGEFHVVNNTVTRFGFKVSCSKPCMVVQYVRNLPAGGDTGLDMRAFLAVLTPDERASSNLIFTVPRMIDTNSYMTSVISIIMNTFPVTGLQLNDTSLADLEWQLVEDSPNCYATVEIESGFYQLHSSEPLERFTAYLYVFQVYTLGPAVGFPIGYGDGTEMP